MSVGGIRPKQFELVTQSGGSVHGEGPDEAPFPDEENHLKTELYNQRVREGGELTAAQTKAAQLAAQRLHQHLPQVESNSRSQFETKTPLSVSGASPGSSVAHSAVGATAAPLTTEGTTNRLQMTSARGPKGERLPTSVRGASPVHVSLGMHMAHPFAAIDLNKPSLGHMQTTAAARGWSPYGEEAA